MCVIYSKITYNKINYNMSLQTSARCYIHFQKHNIATYFWKNISISTAYWIFRQVCLPILCWLGQSVFFTLRRESRSTSRSVLQSYIGKAKRWQDFILAIKRIQSFALKFVARFSIFLKVHQCIFDDVIKLVLHSLW